MIRDPILILTKYTWLAPAIIEMRSLDVVTRQDVAKLLNVNKDVARAILWTLSKLGLVEKVGEGRFKITEALRKVGEKLLELELGEKKSSKSRHLLFYYNNVYYLVTVRMRKIIVKKIGKEVVDKVETCLREQPRTIKELTNWLRERSDRICLALRVLELRGMLKREVENEKVVYKIVSH